MTEPLVPSSSTFASREAAMFPVLTPAQIARIASHGRLRAVAAGEVLVEQGDPVVPFFVVRSGRIEVVRPSLPAPVLVTVHGPGQFTGEVNMISGHRALVRSVAAEAGEVIELERAELLRLVQTDAELGEILFRAFLFRRLELVAHGLGDAVLVGSDHCAGTLRIKEFLNRNGHPYAYVDLEKDAGAQELLDSFAIRLEDVPVLICRGTLVLRNPTLAEIAECLGLNDEIDPAQVRDLVVIGAGPAGLAAAVYGASEGLDVLVLEGMAPGGQAGASSRIENYLGFPNGISGQELTARAYSQAQKFGAQVVIAQAAIRLGCERKPYAVELANGERVRARTVILASGAQYRRLPLENLGRFEGRGIYYGATFMEAQLCGGAEVVVIGGGNSAGQAAIFLAQTARHVHILVRSRGLAETMSRYLIHRIEGSPAITLHPHTEVVGLEGEDHLEGLRWRDNQSGEVEARPLRHLFLMTGAVPSTQWLQGCLALDGKGFVKTGADLSREDLDQARWPLGRSPYFLETSLPGVFAVGDVRGGNMKRIASAVGEGSSAVSFVHRVLQE